jgi:signal peptidase I
MNNIELEYKINGNSMWPTFTDGDKVFIQKISNQKLQVGDILFYKDDYTQEYTIHRLTHSDTTKGDNTLCFDATQSSSPLGIAVGYQHKEDIYYWGKNGQPLKNIISKISKLRTKNFLISKVSKVMIYFLTKTSSLFCLKATESHT